MARSLLTRSLVPLLVAVGAQLWCGQLVDVGAAASPAALRVNPVSPLSSADFTARWRAPKARVRGRRYGVELRIAAAEGSLCTTSRTLAVRRSWNAGDTLTFRLRADDRTLGGDSLWCPSKATLRVVSTKPGSRRLVHATLRFRIRADPANPVPVGTPAEAELLEGSRLSVLVSGRPDRATSLSGRLTGYLLGAGDPKSAAAFRLSAGEIAVDGLVIDPLCTADGRPDANRFRLAASGTSGRVLSDGAFSMTLRIDEDPIGLTGCQGPAGPAGLRTIALSGRSSPDSGLSRIEASGAVDGLAYTDGTPARVAITLVLGFDLSTP